MPAIRQIAQPGMGLNAPFVWNGGDAVKNSSATKALAIVANRSFARCKLVLTLPVENSLERSMRRRSAASAVSGEVTATTSAM
jgi:hypothetical protein